MPKNRIQFKEIRIKYDVAVKINNYEIWENINDILNEICKMWNYTVWGTCV